MLTVSEKQQHDVYESEVFAQGMADAHHVLVCQHLADTQCKVSGAGGARHNEGRRGNWLG